MLVKYFVKFLQSFLPYIACFTYFPSQSQLDTSLYFAFIALTPSFVMTPIWLLGVDDSSCNAEI